MNSQKLIPSMFHRRLVLLLVVIGIITSALGMQLFKLSIVQGAQRLAEAESRLDRRVYLPTHRGRILDRHGRILAEDRASYDIAVAYDVITGAWPNNQAARQARREIGASDWNVMSPEQRDQAIADRLPHWEMMVEDLWAAIREHGELSELDLLQRRDAIRAEVQSMAAAVWDNQRLAWEARFGTEDDEDSARGRRGFRPRPIREQRAPHVILPRVNPEVAFEFRRLARDFDGIVQVQDSRRREMPWSSADVLLDRGDSLPKPLRSQSSVTIRVEGVGDHILGSVRDEVWAEDIQRRPFVKSNGEIDLGGYRVGDAVGSRGLELSFEHHLRGTRGVINERRDTGEQERLEAKPGDDLQITLDIMLQARVQAILSHEYGLTRVQRWHQNDALPGGRPLNSAAVVLEVDTGEILAMVSMPTIEMGRNMSESRRAADDPWVNRPVEAIYPPGSILKPLVLCAAVQSGLHSLHTPINCAPGHFYDTRPGIARCWIFRERYGLTNHGPLRAEEAMARSCNMYFYTLGDRLGMNRASNWFARFGLGQPLDTGLLQIVEGPESRATQYRGESAGTIPTDELIADLRAKGELNFASVILGIGQGPGVTWTPIQAANAYATIARGGVIRDATLVRDQDRLSPRLSREHMQFSPALVDAALEGLRQSVEESHGTGYQIRYEYDQSLRPDRIINVDGVTVWAKTGTAQAPALPVDTTGDGESDSVITGLSHAWFVGLVGPKRGRPSHAIVVIVEYGGSGGRVSGPIANEIIRALKAEGYL